MRKLATLAAAAALILSACQFLQVDSGRPTPSVTLRTQAPPDSPFQPTPEVPPPVY